MVTREEDFRNLETLEINRLRVGWRFQQGRVGEGFLRRRPLAAEGPGKKADNGIADHGTGQCSICQDVVSNTCLLYTSDAADE